MAQLIHLHCRHCGDPLVAEKAAYCPACDLALCYRALPLLLGMLLAGQSLQPRHASVGKGLFRARARRGYDDPNMLLWE